VLERSFVGTDYSSIVVEVIALEYFSLLPISSLGATIHNHSQRAEVAVNDSNLG
jgi:hypothetical protein